MVRKLIRTFDLLEPNLNQYFHKWICVLDVNSCYQILIQKPVKVVLHMWTNKWFAKDVGSHIREHTDHDIIGHISVELLFLLSCDLFSFERKWNIYIYQRWLRHMKRNKIITNKYWKEAQRQQTKGVNYSKQGETTEATW